MQSSPKVIVFDMDGVILDSERLRVEAWMRSSKEHGFDLSEETFHVALGKRKEEAHAAIIEAAGAGFPVESIRALSDRYFQENVKDGIPTKAGISELLDFLDATQMPRVVATSTHKQVAFDRLRQVGLIHRFDHLVGGNEVENSKPHPEIFLTALNHLGFNPRDAYILEDSEAGVTAAHASGARPIHVEDILPPSARIKELAVQLTKSLHEVRNYLGRYTTDGHE